MFSSSQRNYAFLWKSLRQNTFGDYYKASELIVELDINFSMPTKVIQPMLFV